VIDPDDRDPDDPAHARPLAGRVIRGRSSNVLAPPYGAFGYSGGAETLRRVPRLIGFSRRDALHALVLGYLKGRVTLGRGGAGHSRVLAQRPAPGTMLKTDSTVSVVISSPGAPNTSSNR